MTDELDSRLLRHRALDVKVLAVAMRGFGRDFTVYVGPVPGKKHSEEWKLVARWGSKLSDEIARAIFPNLFNRLEGEGLIYRG